MMLNKQILTELIKERIEEDACFDKPYPLKDTDDIHDFALVTYLGGVRIEENDILYFEMCAIVNTDGEEILEEINEWIDDKFTSYYGDPAFASASDYWNYRLG